MDFGVFVSEGIGIGIRFEASAFQGFGMKVRVLGVTRWGWVGGLELVRLGFGFGLSPCTLR